MLNQHTVELMRPLHEATPEELDDYCRYLYDAGWERYEKEVQECVEKAFREWQQSGSGTMATFINPNSPLPGPTPIHHWTTPSTAVRVSRITVRMPSSSVPGIMARAVIERQVREQLDSLPEYQ